jgi:phosphoesterase RecJ-like protein
MPTTATEITLIADAIRTRRRFVIASHSRPDGDAVGSQLAMAYALRALGKQARVISRDPVPSAMLDFPGVSEVETMDRLDDPGDAVIVMECPDLARTGVEGLERGYVINIDHHQGNTLYGSLNVVRELGVPLTPEIATHVYVAILTDTGSFHFSNITPRTFDICRQCVEAGARPQQIARSLYDSSTLGRLKLTGAVLNRMSLDNSGRIAIIHVTQQLALECGATYEDTEGLINQPLTVKAIQAAVFFKEIGPDEWRVSLRSKGDIDVNAVARQFGGGGHRNASGCNAHGPLGTLQATFTQKLTEAIDSTRSDH